MGVVITDLLQFAMAMTGGIALAWFSWRAVEGMAGLTQRLTSEGIAVAADTFSLLPTPGEGSFMDVTFWTVPVATVAVYLGVSWWSSQSVDGGGVTVQRVSASKDERHGMLAITEGLRVLLLSRHLPLREAIASLTRVGVLDHLHLLDETLRGLGVDAPRLALPGLNPHAGEAGLLGTEEQEILEELDREGKVRFDVEVILHDQKMREVCAVTVNWHVSSGSKS